MPYSGGIVRAARTRFLHAPEMEVLHRPLGEVLPFGMRLRIGVRSTTMQETSRWPSSMASPMPTGPPPTMMTRFASAALLIGNHSGVIPASFTTRRHFARSRAMSAPKSAGGPAHGDEALGGQLRHHGRRAQDIIEDVVVFGDDVGRSCRAAPACRARSRRRRR